MLEWLEPQISFILGIAGFGFAIFFISALGAGLVFKFVSVYFPKDSTARTQAMLSIIIFQLSLLMLAVIGMGFAWWISSHG